MSKRGKNIIIVRIHEIFIRIGILWAALCRIWLWLCWFIAENVNSFSVSSPCIILHANTSLVMIKTAEFMAVTNIIMFRTYSPTAAILRIHERCWQPETCASTSSNRFHSHIIHTIWKPSFSTIFQTRTAKLDPKIQAFRRKSTQPEPIYFRDIQNVCGEYTIYLSGHPTSKWERSSFLKPG